MEADVLNLRAGDMVEVRSREEILTTLDKEGKLDALPFMPEMLKYCGQQLKVIKRAHKTCDTISKTGGRSMKNAVHLEGVRCDGEAHGGCQAECLIFWKEAWLRPAQSTSSGKSAVNADGMVRSQAIETAGDQGSHCSEETLRRASRRHSESTASGQERFVCQATELLNATRPLAWWDIRQYITDVSSGNASIGELIRVFLFSMFSKTLKLRGYRAKVWLFNRIQRFRGGTPFPATDGTLTKTPVATLNLRAGELVEIKTQDEIRSTVNRDAKTRGLSFDREMVRYCGGRYKVRSRVEKIINERTGEMMSLPGDCIILDGVVCTSRYSPRRLLCPRSIYPFWREIWLKRVQ